MPEPFYDNLRVCKCMSVVLSVCDPLSVLLYTASMVVGQHATVLFIACSSKC